MEIQAPPRIFAADPDAFPSSLTIPCVSFRPEDKVLLSVKSYDWGSKDKTRGLNHPQWSV